MKPRPINITPVLNGFIVSVGCQTVVIQSPQELGARITEYYKDPTAVERIFIQNKVNDTMDVQVPMANTMDQCCATEACPPPMTTEPVGRLRR